MNVRVTWALLLLLTCAGSIVHAQTPIGYWRFNEGAGATAFDLVGTNNATLQNGATYGAGQTGVIGDFSLDLGAGGNGRRAFVEC